MDKNLSIPMRALCAVVFCIFSFLYLYVYQADLMFVAQHVASNGKTHYVSLIGAILITFTLQLLQAGVYTVTGLYKRCHSLTYFPSLLFLAVLTSVPSDIQDTISFGVWMWIVPILLILYVGSIIIARNYQSLEPCIRFDGLSSQLIWINLYVLAIMMLVVCMIGNHDSQFHDKASMHKILSTEVRSFVYARKSQKLQPDSALADKQLNNALLNKDLDDFASGLKKFYHLNMPLPYHYREALLLHTKQSRKPIVTLKGREMEDAYANYLRLQENKDSLKTKFKESYWVYYDKK